MCKEKAGYYSNRVRTLGQVQTSFIVMRKRKKSSRSYNYFSFMEYLFMLTELQQMACPSLVLRLPIYFSSDV